MVSFSEARDTPVKQLWEEIGDIHAGMLGLEGSTTHMQPMAPFVDAKTNTIWFYTKTDSDLVKHIRPGQRAQFCVIGKDHDYHASLSGVISVRKEPAKIEEYWNSVVEAWYEGGKSDPTLTMLALHLDDGEIWASTSNPIKFGWEIAKANMNDNETPDVGVHRHLNFA
ncbi:pyridoxamine 5'-phosphate oxidase family protein [Rhizobium halophytocola]|uniref:General stress protein 26 n=1 Tax=Rhizobium halophytocola TaxID=735519 RepID=A0ABS4DT49_9HYPH|nr:pyridoxamine 5'-phosphate oxidase family protein [Rhizobium halophytocola]MBP1848865.1 general stress protein 26 [Rhizobium halophytocola]